MHLPPRKRYDDALLTNRPTNRPTDGPTVWSTESQLKLKVSTKKKSCNSRRSLRTSRRRKEIERRLDVYARVLDIPASFRQILSFLSKSEHLARRKKLFSSSCFSTHSKTSTRRKTRFYRNNIFSPGFFLSYYGVSLKRKM